MSMWCVTNSTHYQYFFWSLSFCSLVFDWFNSVIGVHQEREQKTFSWWTYSFIKKNMKSSTPELQLFQNSDQPMIDLKDGNLICLQKNIVFWKNKTKKEYCDSDNHLSYTHDGNIFVDWSDKQNWICRPRSLMWSCWNRFTQMWQCWIITTRIHTLGMLTSSFNCLMPTERKRERERQKKNINFNQLISCGQTQLVENKQLTF